jgi:hypothetical protein
MAVGAARLTPATTPGCIHAPIGTRSTGRDHQLQTLKPRTRMSTQPSAVFVIRPGSTGEARSLSDQAVTPKECQKMFTAIVTQHRSREAPPEVSIIVLGSA